MSSWPKILDNISNQWLETDIHKCPQAFQGHAYAPSLLAHRPHQQMHFVAPEYVIYKMSLPNF